MAVTLEEADDPELLEDLRAMNGNPRNAKLDDFWTAAKEWIVEHYGDTTEERRHDSHGGTTSYMPPTMSVRSMRTQVRLLCSC